jgi:hypothetical protein
MTDRQQELNIQNIRLFPKLRGAAAYNLTGIAARCDWVMMTDGAERKFDVFMRGNPARQPRTVFVSLRSFYASLPFFYHEVLPKISDPFVLVTGSEDITIPNQLDKRYRPFNAQEFEIINRIINDERIIHWFVENRDAPLPKTSSMPIGYVVDERSSCKVPIPEIRVPVCARPLKVLCAHRIREGRQWQTRKEVTQLCNDHFADISTIVTKELSPSEFESKVQAHPFVLCVQGGGLDPSPKAWFSLLHGSIPIIKSSALDDAYGELPVVFVDEWDASCLSIARLRAWREQLAPYYDLDSKRQQTVQRLSIDYWWSKIEEKLRDHQH